MTRTLPLDPRALPGNRQPSPPDVLPGRVPARRVHVCVWRALVAVVVSSILGLPAAAARGEWEALDPAEWSRARSDIDPGAHAEIIFKRVEYEGIDSSFYYRVRIYDEKGVEEYAKIDLELTDGSSLRSIEARTLKPDGTVHTLAQDDIYEREIVKVRGDRVRAKSFAPPGLEAGVVLEYRFERRSRWETFSVMMNFQESRPVRLAQFGVRMPGVGGWVRAMFLNRPGEEIQADKQGWFRLQMENQPALKIEPFAPDFEDVGATAFLYVTFNGGQDPDAYWLDACKDMARKTKSVSRINRASKRVLESILDGTEDDEAKALKIHDFCRTQIINLQRDTPQVLRLKADKLPLLEDVDDVLRVRMGHRDQINEAFMALANAAGLDARRAFVSNRESFPFNRSITESFLLPRLIVALRMREAWVLTDPGATFLPLSMLSPVNTFTTVCIADPEQEVMVLSPNPSPMRSLRHRIAQLVLNPSGELEGTVEETLTGYWAQGWLESFQNEALEEKRKTREEALRESLPGAEVTDFEVSGEDDLLQPLVIRYTLRVPDFAERTGSRLFVAPAVFQRGRDPIFKADERTNRILFTYPWSEFDEIGITYPEDYELEAPSSPAQVDFSGVGKFQVAMRVKPNSREIRLTRAWALGVVLHPETEYPRLKKLFEDRQSSDNHILTLKRVTRPDGDAGR